MNIPLSKPGTNKKNKTGSWRSFKPTIDRKKCVKCGICVGYCPEGCISGPKEKPAVIDYDYCKGCGICANECPAKCIKMEKEEK